MGGYYEYSLYDDCWYNNDVEPPTFMNQSKSYWGPPKFPGMENINTSLLKNLQGGLNDYPCGGVAATFKWLDNELVKDAINVPRDAKIFSGDNGDGFTYNMTEKNLLPFYQELVMNTSVSSCLQRRYRSLPRFTIRTKLDRISWLQRDSRMETLDHRW